MLQAVLGTLFTTLVDLSDPDAASLSKIDDFFSSYAKGSHNFVAVVMDEQFLTGLVTFLVGFQKASYS